MKIVTKFILKNKDHDLSKYTHQIDKSLLDMMDSKRATKNSNDPTYKNVNSLKRVNIDTNYVEVEIDYVNTPAGLKVTYPVRQQLGRHLKNKYNLGHLCHPVGSSKMFTIK